MEYYSKYIKYKNKYTKLKYGGSTHQDPKQIEEGLIKSTLDTYRLVLLSGPVHATYRTVGTKKIILLSDIHETEAKCKEDSLEIDKYLETIFNQRDSTIDFFIEDDWTDIKNTGTDIGRDTSQLKGQDYISKLVKLSHIYYKKMIKEEYILAI